MSEFETVPRQPQVVIMQPGELCTHMALGRLLAQFGVERQERHKSLWHAEAWECRSRTMVECLTAVPQKMHLLASCGSLYEARCSLQCQRSLHQSSLQPALRLNQVKPGSKHLRLPLSL